MSGNEDDLGRRFNAPCMSVEGALSTIYTHKVWAQSGFTDNDYYAAFSQWNGKEFRQQNVYLIEVIYNDSCINLKIYFLPLIFFLTPLSVQVCSQRAFASADLLASASAHKRVNKNNLVKKFASQLIFIVTQLHTAPCSSTCRSIQDLI